SISIPATAICKPKIYKSTPCPGDCNANEAYDVQPESGAPPNKKLKFNNVPPNINNQKPSEFKNGKATSLAPICNGIAKFIKPINNGIPAKNIMVVPCIVIISL